MSNKYYVVAALLLVSFAAGRYLTPVKTEIKTVEVEKKQTNTAQEKHQNTTTVTTEKSDGTKVTETHTTIDTDTQRHATLNREGETQTISTYSGAKTRIQAVVAPNIETRTITYGVDITRNVLGPVTAGVILLTNGTVGVSLGLEF